MLKLFFLFLLARILERTIGTKNWPIMSVSVAGNDTDPFLWFLGPETDIMGKRFFMVSFDIAFTKIKDWTAHTYQATIKTIFSI
jgi:hypothetical protein